jgi:hypothetical protein
MRRAALPDSAFWPVVILAASLTGAGAPAGSAIGGGVTSGGAAPEVAGPAAGHALAVREPAGLQALPQAFRLATTRRTSPRCALQCYLVRFILAARHPVLPLRARSSADGHAAGSWTVLQLRRLR